jgi:hypothetical protein
VVDVAGLVVIERERDRSVVVGGQPVLGELREQAGQLVGGDDDVLRLRPAVAARVLVAGFEDDVPGDRRAVVDAQDAAGRPSPSPTSRP